MKMMVARDGILPNHAQNRRAIGARSNRRRQPFQGCGLYNKGFALALGSNEAVLARAHP